MTRLFFVLALAGVLAACAPLHSAEQRAQADAAADRVTQALVAQAPASDAALVPWLANERTRVAAARDAAQARYQADELVCWRRFAVNDCLREARLQRRASLNDLRRQELALNDIERQRRTAERMRQLEEKQPGARGR